MKPSDVSPLVQLETALNMLGLEPEAISDVAEIQDFMRILMTHETRLYLVDTYIYGVYDWEVDQSGTTQGGPGLFDIDYQGEQLNQQQFFSHIDEIYIHYGGIGSTADGEMFIQARGFMYQGDKYYCSDSSGMLGAYQIGLSHVYVPREQIQGLLSSVKQNTKLTADSNSVEPIISGHEDQLNSIQDARMLIFKTWLVTTANERSKGKKLTTDLQKCYELIGSPTHNDVWAALEKIDTKNFSAGKDDFKKLISKKVTFKTGSRPKPITS